MLRRVRISAALAAVLPLVFAAQGALAESGTYESINSFVSSYASFEHADQTTIIGGPANGVATIFDSSGGPFVKGVSNVIECITFAKKSTAGMDLEAPCTIIDSSGDKNFIVYRRKAGDVSAGGGGQGTIQILGGTGKFAGATGSCTYTVAFFPGNRGVTTQKCRWQKP
ncbi:MAG: hypothetical protein AABM64_02725 [Pseudomonadota bacterium]